MVSDATRNATWHMMLDLERQFRYYTTLADRYAKYYKVIRYLLLFGIVVEGAILYFLTGEKDALWVLAGIGAAIIGFLTIYDASTNYAETSAQLRTTATDVDRLKAKAEQLWRDIEAYRVDDQKADERHNDLVNDWMLATRRIAIQSHNHDNKVAAQAADKDVLSRYAI